MNDETFHATRPFAFYIEDERSGAILYMGVVNDPQEESGLEVAPSRIGEDEPQPEPLPTEDPSSTGACLRTPCRGGKVRLTID